MRLLKNYADVGAPRSAPVLGPGQPVPVIALVDIDPGTATARTREVVAGEVAKWRTAQEGDVLFPRLAAAIDAGRVAIAEELDQGFALVSSELLTLRPKGGASAGWLRAFLRQETVRHRLSRQAVGTTRPRVRIGDVEALEMPELPPAPVLRDQIRAQAAIDELWRQTILLLDLLDRLPIAIVSAAARDAPRIALGMLATTEPGLRRAKVGQDGSDTTACVTARDVVAADVRPGSLRHRIARPAPNWFLQAGDVLVPTVQAESRVGVGLFWDAPSLEPVTFAQTVMRIRPRRPDDGALVWAWLRTEEANGDLVRFSNRMRDSLLVSARVLSELAVPDLPPAEIGRINHAIQAVRRFRADVERDRARIETLRQAHLQSMFPAAGTAVPSVGAMPASAQDLSQIRERLSHHQEQLWSSVIEQDGSFTLDALVTDDGDVEPVRRALRLFEALGVLVTERDGDVVTLRRFDPELDGGGR